MCCLLYGQQETVWLLRRMLLLRCMGILIYAGGVPVGAGPAKPCSQPALPSPVCTSLPA